MKERSIANVHSLTDKEESLGLKKELFEKNVLLSLTKDIAQIKAKGELMHLIKEHFRKLFDFHRCTISIICDDKKTFKIFLVDSDESKIKVHQDYGKLVTNKNTIIDGIYNKILQSRLPVVFDIDELVASGNAPFYVKILHQANLKELLGVSLIYENEPIGVLSFLSEKPGAFIPSVFPLIQGIADQISLAVINTMAIENIKQKEKETEILLSVSNAITTVRDKQGLLDVIKNELIPRVTFSDIAIIYFDKERETFTVFIHCCGQKLLQQPDFQQMVSGEYPINDGIADTASRSETVMVFDIKSLLERSLPAIDFLHRSGIKEMACMRLKSNNEIIGAVVLTSEMTNSFSQQDRNLIQQLSFHLATAVSNILSNEAILQREREKEILLSVSKELTYVRERSDLLPILKSQLERLSFYTDATIIRVDENKETFSAFVINEDPIRMSHPGYVEMANAHHPYPDGVFEIILASDRPVIFDIAELAAWPKPLPYVKFLHENGTVQMVAVRLRESNNENGVLYLFSDKKRSFTEFQLSLVQGIGNQLGAVVANILANERIKRQFEEISKYKQQLEEEKTYLQEQVSGGYTYKDIIGSGKAIQMVFHELSQVSFANSSVLLLGETGTGKELVARAIHNSSPRKDRLMVRVNCAALPASLIESELFGHERGSFTGATEKRIGKFELANHGTLFLDEIGEMPLDLQVKLLRAIQEKEIERVGGKATIKTDVRIIAATNRNLHKEVDEGRFRRDLFYRLNVFPITLPPLRERIEDIPLLAAHFTEKYAKNTGSPQMNVSGKAMKELMSYSWPGNVRELEHVLERSILTTTGQTIKTVHLPQRDRSEAKYSLDDEQLKTHADNEREYILKVLKKCKGKIFGPGGAAEVLNIPVSTLNSKIKKLGIKQNKTYSK
jgi:formate hydrogenlyase transcriptional activator